MSSYSADIPTPIILLALVFAALLFAAMPALGAESPAPATTQADTTDAPPDLPPDLPPPPMAAAPT